MEGLFLLIYKIHKENSVSLKLCFPCLMMRKNNTDDCGGYQDYNLLNNRAIRGLDEWASMLEIATITESKTERE